MRSTALLAAALILTFVGCKKTHVAGNVPNGRSQPTTPTHPAKILAAAVLTKEEVALVQSTPITEVKSTENFDGRYVVSQCFYNAVVANKSVSFSLTEPSAGGGANANPREYWDKINEQIGIMSVQFHEAEKKRGDSRSAGEEPEGKRAFAKKIDGVGEQAYWVCNRVGGTLYVLQQDFILKISVGGGDEEQIKIEKSKGLARKAIARL